MEDNCNIKKDKPEFVYKYLTFEQFIDLVEMKRLYLKNIKLWEDCYEGDALQEFEKYLFNNILYINGDIPDKINQYVEAKIKSIFAQSWTKMTNESDALWRIYSPQKTGVRIKIRREYIYKQIKSLEKSKLYYAFDEGSVEYDKKIDYDAYKNKDSFENNFIVDEMSYLCMKRKAFEHEEEYRFTIRYNMMHNNSFQKTLKKGDSEILLNGVSEFNYPEVIYYELQNEMIDQVLLDPRAPEYFEETFINYCNNRRFQEKNIEFRKSKLYTKE